MPFTLIKATQIIQYIERLWFAVESSGKALFLNHEGIGVLRTIIPNLLAPETTAHVVLCRKAPILNTSDPANMLNRPIRT